MTVQSYSLQRPCQDAAVARRSAKGIFSGGAVTVNPARERPGVRAQVALPVHAAHRDDGVIRAPHKRPVCRSVGFLKEQFTPQTPINGNAGRGPRKRRVSSLKPIVFGLTGSGCVGM